MDYNVKHRSTILGGGISITEEELIEKVATDAKLSKADAARALNTTLNAVKGAPKKGQKDTLIGFGALEGRSAIFAFLFISF